MSVSIVSPKSFSAVPTALRAWLALTLSLLLGTASAAQPESAQRDAFRHAYAVALQGGDGWRTQAGSLHSYVLFPYLEAAALTHDLKQLDRATVADYLARYPDTIPAADLRRDYLLQAAQQQNWTDFLALYQPGLGDTLSCDALQARLAQGNTLDFNRDLASLWAKASLPAACTPVLQSAHEQGLLDDAQLWARIDHAIAAAQGDTVALLAGWLRDDAGASAQHLAQALRDPSGAVSAAAGWADTPRDRQAAALAVQRLARRNTSAADAAWQQLQGRFNFSATQRSNVLYGLALYHATDFDENALVRLADLPDAVRTDASREWRARVALARQDWPAVLAAISAMPTRQQNDGEWRYFHARALAATGGADQAHAFYAALAREPTYFGFLAADQIDADYAICPLDPRVDQAREQALLSRLGMQRALELYAVGLPRFARREWSQALAGADTPTLHAAVRLAYQRGWYDRAVFAFSSGEALRYYTERFPLASQDGVVPQAEQAGIDPAWAYAIARAESAWMTDARSGANARGLMQLLPATAARVAQRNGLNWNGAESLYDPKVNVMLGTRYLAQMAERFNGAPWLASAAYNAGPGKVDQWLAARSNLPPDVFVASIPYKETREYVARVMAFAVIYDWRMDGQALPMSARMPPIGQPYSRPDVHTAKRTVRCPAPLAPAAASATSASAAAAAAAAAAATSVAAPASNTSSAVH